MVLISVNISSIVSTIIMKLSTVAILLGAAVSAVPGVVSAEVSSCFDGRCSSEDASREVDVLHLLLIS